MEDARRPSGLAPLGRLGETRLPGLTVSLSGWAALDGGGLSVAGALADLLPGRSNSLCRAR